MRAERNEPAELGAPSSAGAAFLNTVMLRLLRPLN